jgi:hypothetical protein
LVFPRLCSDRCGLAQMFKADAGETGGEEEKGEQDRQGPKTQTDDGKVTRPVDLFKHSTRGFSQICRQDVE